MVDRYLKLLEWIIERPATQVPKMCVMSGTAVAIFIDLVMAYGKPLPTSYLGILGMVVSRFCQILTFTTIPIIHELPRRRDGSSPGHGPLERMLDQIEAHCPTCGELLILLALVILTEINAPPWFPERSPVELLYYYVLVIIYIPISKAFDDLRKAEVRNE